MFKPTPAPNSTVEANSSGSHARPAAINSREAQNRLQEMPPTTRTGNRSTTNPAASAVTVAVAASMPKASDTVVGLNPNSTQCGTRCTLAAPSRPPRMANAALSRHMAGLRAAPRSVQASSDAVHACSDAGPACSGAGRRGRAPAPRAARAGPPSGSRPRSPGWRRSNSTSGSVAAENQARTTHAARQPRLLISICVSGRSNAPPTPRPSCTMPVARPRRRMNHFATGTVANSALPPAPVQPLAPSASSTPNSTAADCTRASTSSPAVAITIAASTGTRGP